MLLVTERQQSFATTPSSFDFSKLKSLRSTEEKKEYERKKNVLSRKMNDL